MTAIEDKTAGSDNQLIREFKKRKGGAHVKKPKDHSALHKKKGKNCLTSMAIEF